MSNSIVANGCSFTEEAYLEPQDRWTNKCGISTNLAHGGGSNDRIFYTTIEYLNKHTIDTLIIGWSSVNRFMLPNANGSRIVGSPIHTFDENLGGDYSDYSKFYYKHCYNRYTSLESTLNYMLHIQDHCKQKRIKLLYFNAFLPDIDDKSLEDYSKDAYMSKETEDMTRMGINFNKNKLLKLIDKLTKNIWIEKFWYSMQAHCKDFPLEKGGHPDVEGSEHWATLVKKYL
tara:strand:+ start:90 stop:779 length:690 start_codon:yes stop_codon:yes gene_type:complete